MLFASHNFLFIFLPVALVGYYFATKVGATCSAAWLALCSLAFYACWNVTFVILLLCSIAFNFLMGRALLAPARAENEKARNRLLFFGIAGNLLPLFFYKYAAAVLSAAHAFSLVSPSFDFKVILPLGISFFTFTQIGYLVDCQQGEGKDLDIIRYTAFVTFFPHLVAGPILHIREIAPQLLDPETYHLRARNLSIGATYFVLGLSKKTLLADPLADVVAIGFSHPHSFAMFSSWLYALAYSVQLYFDFSGYSDMAIGLAYMFGIRFPVNFDSPYKSTNIIDFWQRWHMTLTRYLNLLIYNPIALHITRLRARAGHRMSRRDNAHAGAFLTMIMTPLFITMVLAGIWHGAGLQFLVWGLMHFCYLTINHAWRVFGPQQHAAKKRGRLAGAAALVFQVLLTYVAVVATQVMFRAASVRDALQLLGGMIGLHGFDAFPIPGSVMGLLAHFGPVYTFLTHTHHFLVVPTADSLPPPASLALRFFIVWALPNTQTIMAKFSPTLTAVKETAPRWLTWQPTVAWALAFGFLLALDLMSLQQTKVFLYFQF